MKFAKRLACEASRKGSFAPAYFDYRAAKKAIKDDIQKSDVTGANFRKLLESELRKVSQFYSEAADRIEATLQFLRGDSSTGPGSAQQLALVRSEVKELIKFVALNYLAVVKAIKKRNRRLKETFGSTASTSLQALDLLGHEVFFTSPRLASLATQADVLATLAVRLTAQGHKAAAPAATVPLVSVPAADAVLEDYQCPICLDTLHNPVVLTCAHRFCWGCLVAHVTAVRSQQITLESAASEGKGTGAGSSTTTSLQLLERIASQDDNESGVQRFYNCPVCRKPQLLDVDSLSVDPFLSNFIESLRVLSVTGGDSVAAAAPAVPHKHTLLAISAPVEPPPSSTPSHWGILPPQRPGHAGRLCVLLDLDGTLVSSYTPRRAPRLPPYVRTHIVGIGSKLNPGGVFVVERPGLREFLHELASFAEIIVFTAGLEDYARPIIDALEPHGRLFAHRIYREGTLRTEHYQCVKDMARLGRDMARTVLVDDTPLAFLHQPNNGVPVLGFRGDPDDRLLMEAVLPLMQVLSKEADVRMMLQRRFDMTAWFRRNGFPIDSIMAGAEEAVLAERLQKTGEDCATTPAKSVLCDLTVSTTTASAELPTTRESTTCSSSTTTSITSALHRPCYRFLGPRQAAPTKRFALITNFDKTLIDFDAGEALVEKLAPELLPMLLGLDAHQSYIPITNTILSEIQRRGVSRDQLLTALQQLGGEVPLATGELLRMLYSAGIPVKILSDCNSLFISHILAGAKIKANVQEIITNPAVFEQLPVPIPQPNQPDLSEDDSSAVTVRSASPPQQHSSGQRLVIRPHYDGRDQSVVLPSDSGDSTCCGGCGDGSNSGGHHIAVGVAAAAAATTDLSLSSLPARPHCCPRCVENMCKGLEVQRLLHGNVYSTLVYCGDGANDVCAALALRPQDVVLARGGSPLASYIEEAQGNPALAAVVARVAVWMTHEELLACVRQVMDLRC